MLHRYNGQITKLPSAAALNCVAYMCCDKPEECNFSPIWPSATYPLGVVFVIEGILRPRSCLPLCNVLYGHEFQPAAHPEVVIWGEFSSGLVTFSYFLLLPGSVILTQFVTLMVSLGFQQNNSHLIAMHSKSLTCLPFRNASI